MPKAPPIAELEFLKLTSNHGEFSRKLTTLSNPAASDIDSHAQHLAACWYRLGEQHLLESRAARVAGASRTVYSRTYYAAYNASKAVRYLVNGWVSLKGDDHKEAPNLPDKFPDAAKWSGVITKLYENRLRADYDNWSSTSAEFSLSTTDAVLLAEQFLAEAKAYLNSKFGTII